MTFLVVVVQTRGGPGKDHFLGFVWIGEDMNSEFVDASKTFKVHSS